MHRSHRLRDGLASTHAFQPVILILLSGLSCVHLVQPQTYYLDTARVRLQWDEYLNKELMAGLPEPLFQRWYTRTDAWKDGFRPYILDKKEEDGRMVYKVGTGGRTLAQIYFKGGHLDEVGAWDLTQEAFLSAWTWDRHRPSLEMDAAILERLERLDPPSEILTPEKHRGDGHICDFAEGTVVEAISPLYLTGSGVSKPSLSQRRKSQAAPSDEPVLPAGAELRIESWGMGAGRAVLEGGSGKGYRVEILPGEHGLCPKGACAHVGSEGILSRDLTVAIEETGTFRRAIAVASGQTRIPVWMERVGTVPAGTRVRVISWSPCEGLRPSPGANAEIEVLGEPASAPLQGRSLPARLSVLLAPPGFFRPPPPEGVSASARSLIE